MARGGGKGKPNPGRADRKVVLEYSSDESPDEKNPRPVEEAEAPKRVKKQIHLTLPTSPAHVITTETFATFSLIMVLREPCRKLLRNEAGVPTR